MTTKTYFLPPNFLNYPANDVIKTGRIRLGQIIHDIKDPAYTIETLPPKNLDDYPDITIQSMDIGSVGHTDTAANSFLGSLFVKAIGLVGARLRVDTSRSQSLLSTLDGLQSLTIDPSNKYVADSLGQKTVQDWLNERWFNKRIFMVTSVLIARPSADGSKIDLSTSAKTEAEASGEGDGTLASAGAAPVQGGAESKATFQKEFGLSFVPKTPFVYGFQVRECNYDKKRNKGSSEAYYKGAPLHNDNGDGAGRSAPKLPSAVENVPTKTEYVFASLEPEEVGFDDLGDMDEDFVPDESEREFCLVAVKPPAAG